MYETPLVSIILPVYNGEKTLKDTIESLLGQTFKNFELLVGIDGTKDGSRKITESFKDERILVIENEQNLGLARNLNALILKTSIHSKYIAIAEQDDYYMPHRITWQVEVMEQHLEVGIVSGITEFISDNSKVLFPGLLVNNHQFPQGVNLFKFLYINQLKVVNSCMMIRKVVHQSNNIEFRNIYGNFNVDWDYVLRMSLITQIYGIPKVLVKMNRRSNNNSVTKQKWQQFAASRQLLKNFKINHGDLINTITYDKALKAHRKIELGYRSHIGIIGYGIFYSAIYLDLYFLRYIWIRFKKFIKKIK